MCIRILSRLRGGSFFGEIELRAICRGSSHKTTAIYNEWANRSSWIYEGLFKVVGAA